MGCWVRIFLLTGLLVLATYYGLPYVIGQTIIFSCCFFLLLLSFFSSPNLSGRRLDVYHSLAVWHMV